MHPKQKRKVNTILLILCLLTVSPNLPQQTRKVTHGDSEDKVLRNDEDEGATEKEGDNVATDDRDTESEDVQYTADEAEAREVSQCVEGELCETGVFHCSMVCCHDPH